MRAVPHGVAGSEFRRKASSKTTMRRGCSVRAEGIAPPSAVWKTAVLAIGRCPRGSEKEDMWWNRTDLHRLPPRCHRGALLVELRPQRTPGCDPTAVPQCSKSCARSVSARATSRWSSSRFADEPMVPSGTRICSGATGSCTPITAVREQYSPVEISPQEGMFVVFESMPRVQRFHV